MVSSNQCVGASQGWKKATPNSTKKSLVLWLLHSSKHLNGRFEGLTRFSAKASIACTHCSRDLVVINWSTLWMFLLQVAYNSLYLSTYRSVPTTITLYWLNLAPENWAQMPKKLTTIFTYTLHIFTYLVMEIFIGWINEKGIRWCFAHARQNLLLMQRSLPNAHYWKD